MGLLDPRLPDYDALAWRRMPLAERGRLVCEAWATQGYGTPLLIFVVYALKVLAYVGGWLWFCSFTPGLGGLDTLGSWWLEPIAFEKAILFSMLFEGLGLGCGSGPLTGRYLPPVGGALYWLRPGTTKLPVFQRLPLLGGHRRSLVDVLLYAAVIGLLVTALVQPVPTAELLWAIVMVVVALGLADRTIAYALRAEHFWVTVVVFAVFTTGAPGDGAPGWIAGAKAVQLALWFFAGVSKLNHHFPSVVCVMTSNAPLTRGRLHKLMYKSFPDDLRPSALAVAISHFGTALELGIPLVLLIATGDPLLTVGMVMVLMLHVFITSSVPMGVPLEWNVITVYGAFALFWAHPDVTLWGGIAAGPWWLWVLIFGLSYAVPIVGNLWPERVPFLFAMRYYAGNWPYSIWLFKEGTEQKLTSLTTSAAWLDAQLAHFYDEATTTALLGKVMGFRMMHLQGRVVAEVLPRAAPDLSERLYVDGELIAGFALGWNFGDGHLHHEALLAAIQAQCGFEEGELRCLFVEGQPVHRPRMRWRTVDAKTGLLEEGEVSIAKMRARQPWEAAAQADAG
jgi:hypothetical protein